mmetsp:Transcript_5132/g.8857  ORF Transcript_5132/g.8857 Transcript_5132/m.8857 type:complete len:146 (+) Transcript_5132:31-468(+)
MTWYSTKSWFGAVLEGAQSADARDTGPETYLLTKASTGKPRESNGQDDQSRICQWEPREGLLPTGTEGKESINNTEGRASPECDARKDICQWESKDRTSRTNHSHVARSCPSPQSTHSGFGDQISIGRHSLAPNRALENPSFEET